MPAAKERSKGGDGWSSLIPRFDRRCDVANDRTMPGARWLALRTEQGVAFRSWRGLSRVAPLKHLRRGAPRPRRPTVRPLSRR